MDRMRALAGAALVGMAAAAGCAGGGSSPVPHASTAPTTAQFSISVPVSSTSSSIRRPNFDAPGGTQSVSITLASVNGSKQTGTPTVANLSSSATGCSTSGNTLTCTVTVSAVAGTDLYTVTSYSQPNAQGTQLGTGTASVNAVAGQSTTAPVTLSGTIASITLTLGTPPVAGVAYSIPLVVIAKDSSGATIMGTYNAPITLTDSDTSGATKLSATSLADSTAASNVTIAYTGANLATPPSFGAASGSVTATALSFKPNTDYTVQDGATLSYAMTATWTETQAGQTPSPAQTGSGTLDATYSTGASFNGEPGLIKVHQSSPTSINGMFFIGGNNASEDYYYKWMPTKSGANLFEAGYQESWLDSQNATQTYTTVVSGNGYEMAQVPFTSGDSWSAAGDATTTYDYPEYDSSSGAVIGSYSGTETDKADGSYHDVYTNKSSSGTYTDDSLVNADGTAVETTTDVNSSTSTTDVYTVGTPAPAPSGTPGTAIEYTDTFTQSSPAPTATSTPDVWYGPNWYPGGKPPAPLTSDTITDKGSGAIPADCNISSTTAASAEDLHEVYSDTDPWGYTGTMTTDYYYAPGVGLVCGIMDLLDTEYDTRTTGQAAYTYEWKIVQALTSTSLQGALRKTNSMSAARSFTSAGLQAELTRLARQALAKQRMTRVQHRRSSLLLRRHAT